MQKQPEVIFLDAVGTLFSVRGSVGEIYGDLAGRFGVSIDPNTLNTAFFQSFREAPPIAFPGVAVADISGREFDWWQSIASETFYRAGVLHQFSDFSAFFEELYIHFATAAPWFVYPDTLRFIEYWRDRNVPLAILSNFDSRIYAVLEELKLKSYFASITISTEVGAAKPDPQIFHAALAKHSCTPQAAWHVGDSFREDYEGAKAAGLRGFWLKRKHQTVLTVQPEDLKER